MYLGFLFSMRIAPSYLCIYDTGMLKNQNGFFCSMASGRVLSGLFKTNAQKLQLGIWPWTQGLRSRLPDHFKKRYTEKFVKDPTPVHYQPDPQKYAVNTYGIVYVYETVFHQIH